MSIFSGKGIVVQVSPGEFVEIAACEIDGVCYNQ